VKKLIMITILLSAFFSTSLNAQTKQDSLEVLETVSLYNQGWYEGDSTKMSKALHPELVKRMIQKYKDTGNDIISDLSYNMMMQYVIAGYGKHTPKEKQNDTVTILDIYGDIATLKVDSYEIVDYLQLAKFDEKWKIINILWTMKPYDSEK
jgi:hypothetical protein